MAAGIKSGYIFLRAEWPDEERVLRYPTVRPLKDPTPAAAIQFPQDAKPGNGLANHWREPDLVRLS